MRRMRKTVLDPNLPFGKLIRIKDVLPRPEQLVVPQKSRKVDGRRKTREDHFPRRDGQRFYATCHFQLVTALSGA